MKDWLRVIVGAVATGAFWAAAWSATGALIGVVDQRGIVAERWVGPAIGVLPGFVGGVVFAAALGIAARPRGFHELSFLTVLVAGAIVGMLLGVMPLGINKPPDTAPLWQVVGVVIGAMTFMSAASAAGAVALARWYDVRVEGAQR